MTDTYLISPAERPPISSLGVNSPLPERLGVDVLWEGIKGLCGCQRKDMMDLIASVRDGRLGKELQQMQQLQMGFFIIEGQANWDREGNLMASYSKWTLRQHYGVLLSIQTKGYPVLTSRNPLDTCAVIDFLHSWTMKDEHVSSLIVRDKAPRNGWGRADDKTTFTHIFSAVDLISSEMSQRIFDMHGNILTLTVGEEELAKVPGLGPKRIKSILSTFGVTDAN